MYALCLGRAIYRHVTDANSFAAHPLGACAFPKDVTFDAETSVVTSVWSVISVTPQ